MALDEDRTAGETGHLSDHNALAAFYNLFDHTAVPAGGQAWRWDADQSLYVPGSATYTSVKSYGATGDGTTDDTAAIQAAIDAVEAGGRGIVFLPAGDYRTTATLTVTVKGVKLIGEGAGRSKITADHSAGPVVRIMNFFSGVRALTIDASTARKEGAAGSNYGILMEPVDAPSGQAKFCQFDYLDVRDQPSHGIALVAGFMATDVAHCNIWHNKGHGVIIDNGTLTGRTNKARPGGIKIESCVIQDNVGHGIVAGGADSNQNYAYRLHIENVDLFRNALVAGVRRAEANVWLFCESSLLTLNAFGGFSGSGGVTPATAGLWIAGKSNTVLNNRFVQVTPNAITVGNITEFPTEGITIDELIVTGPEQVSLDPAIVTAAGASRVTARTLTNDFITTLIVYSESDVRTSEFAGIRRVAGSLNVSSLQPTTGFRFGNQINIADDGVAVIEFDGPARGVLVLSGNTATMQAAIIHFRVGSATHCTKLVAGADVDVTTGALTGTTGTDGKLTISVHTDNKLYIENRRGGASEFQPTLLSLRGGNIV